MKQWPLTRELVLVINILLTDRLVAGQVRKSISLYSSPAFCVQNFTEGWQILHAIARQISHGIGPDIDTQKRSHHTWCGKECHLFVHGSDELVLSDPNA